MKTRLFTRLHTPISVKYTFADGFNGRAIVNNISLEGVCLTLTQKPNISPGANLMLKITMPKRKRETVIFGEVIWLQQVDALKDANYLAGIKFVKLDPLDIEEIISSLRTGLYFTSPK